VARISTRFRLPIPSDPQLLLTLTAQKLLGNLAEHSEPVPDILNRTFHAVDRELSEMAAQGTTHSGCTAVTAFLRLEDTEGKPVKGDLLCL
jgi:hypothetical protein